MHYRNRTYAKYIKYTFSYNKKLTCTGGQPYLVQDAKNVQISHHGCFEDYKIWEDLFSSNLPNKCMDWTG